MSSIQSIFESISAVGFAEPTLLLINELINDIQNGSTNFHRFNLSEHAGLCKGGPHLIGASIVACYATGSLGASGDAAGSQRSPANWEIIDEVSGKAICIDCIVKFAG